MLPGFFKVLQEFPRLASQPKVNGLLSLQKLGSKQNPGLEHPQPVAWVCFNQCFELTQHPAWLLYLVPFIYAHRQQPGVPTTKKCWVFFLKTFVV